MLRTITVKGVGTVSLKSDYVVLSMTLESTHKKYDKAMDNMASSIKDIQETLMAIGFDKDSIKTTDFNAEANYERVAGENRNYTDIFIGYTVKNHLKLSFDFDMKKLSQTLSAISKSKTNPKFSINFTVKDTSAVSEELLRNATIDAKRKAEILCDASGVVMGSLNTIECNWGELRIYSNTSFTSNRQSTMDWMTNSIDIKPEDIIVRDNATFVWEII